MTSTSAGPSLDAAPSDDTERWTLRLVGVLVALIWPTQMLAASGILGAYATSSVAQSFHTTYVAWFGLTFVLVTTLVTPFVMKLGDRYGKKRLMLVITGIGTVGDIIAATAGSFWLMLIGRAIAGCYGPFGALSFPAVRDIFPARLVKPASAILGSSVGLVGVGAPFLAGWLVDNWGYQGVMWFITAATALSFVLIAFLVPPTPPRDERPGFDWLGGLVLGGGLTAVIYALGQGQSWGWADAKTLGWLASGLVTLVVFVFVERSSAHPILDFTVLRRRPVALVLTAGGLAQAIAYTMPSLVILLALYPHIPGVSAGLGWTAQHNAAVGVTWNLVMFGTGIVASRLMRRVDARHLWWAGLLLMGLGYGLAGFFHADETELILSSCVANLGSGLVVSGAPVLVVGVVSKDEQGLGSGMLNMLITLFGSVFTALAFAVLASHSVVSNGTAFYQDAGYDWIFWTGALLTAVPLTLSVFVPRLRDPAEIDGAHVA